MATVALSLPPASLKANARKVTIAGYAGAVTLDIARPETDWRNLADSWEETQRASGRPILDRTGQRLRSFTVSALLTKERVANPSGVPADIVGELATLAALAAPGMADRTIQINYDNVANTLARGPGWVISDLSARVIARRATDNYPVRAELDITITEASRPITPGSPASPLFSTAATTVGPPPPPPSTSPTPTSTTRRHTVKAGETLFSIAVRYYGNGAYWDRIASANGIRDIRAISVGQVLTIP